MSVGVDVGVGVGVVDVDDDEVDGINERSSSTRTNRLDSTRLRLDSI